MANVVLSGRVLRLCRLPYKTKEQVEKVRCIIQLLVEGPTMDELINITDMSKEGLSDRLKGKFIEIEVKPGAYKDSIQFTYFGGGLSVPGDKANGKDKDESVGPGALQKAAEQQAKGAGLI